MGVFDQFLSAASARAAQREQEGRQGNLPQIDIAEWWKELMRKREEEMKRRQQMAQFSD